MVFPPGQGKWGPDLMALWRRYLEEYAEAEGDVDAQVVVGANYAARVFASLGLLLDREGRYRALIETRVGYFDEGIRRAASFEERLMVAAFSIYNHLNTLSRQFSGTSPEASQLIEAVDAAVRVRVEEADVIGRTAAALRAAFPLLGVMTLVLDEGKRLTDVIQKVEARFAAGDSKAGSDWDRLVNALYRIVEMLQLFVTLSDAELRDQVQQIAARFTEEDQTADLRIKLRNGFCRAFELGHLVTIHLDEVLPA